MLRKAFRINGGRGNNQFKIRAFRQQLFENTQQKVDIDAAFMRFVDDDGVVLRQVFIILNFGQQNPIGHHLNQTLFMHLIVKTDLVTHQLSQG